MFKLQHRTTLACTLCFFALTACANQDRESSDTNTQTAPLSVVSAVSDWSEAASIPGVAIAYIHDSEIQWIYTQGQATANQTVTEDTLFNIASLTKPMFSMMSLQLVEHGRLNLDESLSQHWVDPDIKGDQRHEKLTPRLALSHQTGFTNWRGDKPLSFMFSPGQRHEYSGEGFEYLKKAIELKLDTSMPQLMQHYVVKPSRMNNTYFGWKDNLGHTVAERFDEAGETIQQQGFYRESYSAACCTLSSIKDYAAFIRWVSQGAGLSDDLLQQLQTAQAQHGNPIEYFSLGWRLVTTPSTTYLVHDGREPGVRALTIVSPSTGEGLVILTNSSNGELLYRPLAQVMLKNPQHYLSQADKDTWQYLTSVPSEMQPRMIEFIAQSPSFTSKALYAANEAVFAQSRINIAHEKAALLKKRAVALIDAFVLEQLSATQPQTQEQLRQNFIAGMTFLSTNDKSLSLSQTLDTKVTIEEWMVQLETMSELEELR